MEIFPLRKKRPIPLNPDLIRGILTTRVCTDIVAPELMDVSETETVTYKLYQAQMINFNKPEPGYPVHTYDDSAFTMKSGYEGYKKAN